MLYLATMMYMVMIYRKPVKELKNEDIQLLQDETILINNAFYLAGRRDQAEEKRKEVYQINKRKGVRP